MNARDRLLSGEQGFDIRLQFWIFSISFSFSMIRIKDIKNPKWIKKLTCKLGKHSWWIDTDKEDWIKNPSYSCIKCGIKNQAK